MILDSGLLTFWPSCILRCCWQRRHYWRWCMTCSSSRPRLNQSSARSCREHRRCWTANDVLLSLTNSIRLCRRHLQLSLAVTLPVRHRYYTCFVCSFYLLLFFVVLDYFSWKYESSTVRQRYSRMC